MRSRWREAWYHRQRVELRSTAGELAEEGVTGERRWRLERAVLGVALADRRQRGWLVDVLEPEVFDLPAHRELWSAVLAAEEPTTSLAVASELARRGVLDRIGGLPWINGVRDAAPDGADLYRWVNAMCLDEERRRQ